MSASLFSQLKGADRKRFETLLTFLGDSYIVRASRVSNGRYGIDIEEVGTSTIYKLEARTIEQLCDSAVTHIIKDRSGRPVSETADTSTTFVATASGMGGAVLTEVVIREIEESMKREFPSFYSKSKIISKEEIDK